MSAYFVFLHDFLSFHLFIYEIVVYRVISMYWNGLKMGLSQVRLSEDELRVMIQDASRDGGETVTLEDYLDIVTMSAWY